MSERTDRDGARLFRLFMGLGSLSLLAAAIAVAIGIASVHLGGSPSHGFAVAGHRFAYPEANAAAIVVLVLAGFGAIVLTMAIRDAWGQLRSQRAVLRRLIVRGPLDGHPDVSVIEHERPQAFCAGYRHPRVYISTAAVALLSPVELDAVLAHERHHAVRRDPLRIALARVLTRSLFFLPVLRALSDRYSALAEFTADDAAVEASGGDRAPLAGAMLAFVGRPGRAAVVGIAPERVDHLLGRTLPWQLPAALLAGAVITIAAIVAVMVGASHGASVRASLNLPILSSQPCVLVLALVPVLIGVAVLVSVKRVSRS